MHCFRSGTSARSALCAALFLTFTQTALAQPAFVAPPEPRVRPTLPSRGEIDADNNRIDDRIDRRVGEWRRALGRARSAERRATIAARLAEPAPVELVFTSQVTQKQIDDFLALGGRIEHLYAAVSYGWSGSIPAASIDAVRSAMGDSLLVVSDVVPAQMHMDEATRSGRVRPVWAAGFAGNAGGVSGTSDITVGVLDSGVDDSHTDLAGRNEYWKDYTTDNEATPRDIGQHGSHVTGIAVGSGAAFGIGPGTLRYTDSGNLTGVAANSFFLSMMHLPPTAVTWTENSTWIGGGSTVLRVAARSNGVSGGFLSINNSATVGSPISLVSNTNGNMTQGYSSALAQSSTKSITLYATTNSITNYAAVGDGFNAMRGVAAGAKWAGGKVFTNAGSGSSNTIGAAIDDFVVQRSAHNIKVINMSLGLIGNPGTDSTLRAKANSAVSNGIVVVASAGNDGPGSANSNVVDDPGRAALVITVGASNDNNALTSYTSSGFASPGADEDSKPDLLAPGGSDYYSAILSVDSNDSDADSTSFADRQSNDYMNIKGTSMASPFVAGSAALLIDAMQKSGVTWAFSSSAQPLLVKMLLCASSTETNANREAGTGSNPTLGRAAAPKDLFEGYGIMNPDAAIEAFQQSYSGGTLNGTTDNTRFGRRAWGRKIAITSGPAVTLNLEVPANDDYDLYLYSGTPDAKGNPVIVASSTNSGNGVAESLTFTPTSSDTRYLFVKRVSGALTTTCQAGTDACSLSDPKTCAGTNTACLAGQAALVCACQASGETCDGQAQKCSRTVTWTLTSGTAQSRCGDGTKQAGEDCDDGNQVGGDCCSASCSYENSGSPCNDGLFCTASDSCNGSGSCVGSGNPCSTGGECANSCSEANDNCFSATGTSCSSDSNPCTLDQCNGQGSCVHTAGNAGAVCRAAGGVCDVQETCTGGSTSCPADAFAGTGTVCRNANGVCDLQENCSGASASCPADGFAPSSSTCRGAVGICDVAEHCSGSSGACPANGFASNTQICRGSAGVCDLAETCSGSSAACPSDVFAATNLQCRASGGVCDAGESCTGTSANCPADVFSPSASVCRPASGVCDATEKCSGSSADCPVDSFAGTNTTCRTAGSVCDVAESCNGSSAICPTDAFASSSTVCRGASGVCDVAEHCSGSSGVCPSDAFAASSLTCRGANDVCDAAENCSGTSAGCPADAFASSSTVCRAASGICDASERCSGTSGSCPADGVATTSVSCRASAGECDVAEHCDGAAKACPADGFASADTGCSSDGLACTEDLCSGSSTSCTHAAGNAGTVCRASAGVCDTPETCSGSSTSCPANAFEPSSTVCRGSGGICDLAETCSGASASCPADAVAPTALVCRASAGECDTADRCNGADKACPADGFVAADTGCTSDGVLCTRDVCNGSSADCKHPAGNAGTVCRGSVGICDAVESCDGTSTICPTDGFASASSVCRGASGVCDLAETCSGSSAGCPADGVADASVACRAAAGECDLPESCSGSAKSCPADLFVSASTGCTNDGNVCTDDVCGGSSAACTHPDNSASCNDGVFCNGADSCSAGSCSVHAGDPCSGPDGDASCAESCNEAADACTAADPNGTPCDDGVFCNGADSCSGGTCSVHAGSPCPGADGDGNCSESCDEAADACTAPDENGSPCDDGKPCTSSDSCTGGVCAGSPSPQAAACGTTTTTLQEALCGDANDDGKITAADALKALRTAVGSISCEPWFCDFNGDAKITASDALAILRTAVGQDLPEKCPPAGAGLVAATTTTTTVTTPSTTLNASY